MINNPLRAWIHSAWFGKVFDHAEDVGGLHDQRGEFRILLEVLKAGAALFGHRKVAHFNAVGVAVRVQHRAVMRMQGLRNRHGAALGQAAGHQRTFGQRGRAVVHGGVGHFHAEQTGDERLEFKDALQRTLADFRLVRRVGGVKFGTADKGRDNGGDVVLVASRADPRGTGRGHGSGQRFSLRRQFPLRHGGQRKRAFVAAIRRDGGKKVLHPVGADDAEHLRFVFRGVGEITMHYRVSRCALYAAASSSSLTPSADSISMSQPSP